MTEKVSSFWQKRIKEKTELLKKDPESIKEFKRNMLSEGIYDSFPSHTTEFLHIVEAKAFPNGPRPFTNNLFYSSCKGNPNTIRFYNMQTTLADFEYVYMFYQLESELLKREAPMICEIGAGYGGLAQKILMGCKKIKSYTLIDFEPHRKLQQYFLGEDVRVSYCAANSFPQHEVDIVINTRSMMEMDYGEIKFYLGEIEKWLVPGGLFYLITKDKVTRFQTYPFDGKWTTTKTKKFPTPNSKPMTEYFLRRDPI